MSGLKPRESPASPSPGHWFRMRRWRTCTTDIENLGKIFKVEDRAAELIAQIQGQIDEVQEAVKDVPEEERVRAFVLDTFNGNEIYTTSSGLESKPHPTGGRGECDERDV